MASTVSGISFGATRPAQINSLGVESGSEPKDSCVASVAAEPTQSMGKRMGLLAMGGLALAGGVGLMAAAPQAANAYPVSMQCQMDPYQMQDEVLLNHMSTLYASPATGYNRAAGVYDADGGIYSQANELSRLDGHQALKQLSCGHPVRLYSPQTGWLKFHNLNQLHAYVGENGEPWDMPGVYLGSGYTAGYGSPWYDSDYNQYNDYNAYANGFYDGLNTPSWTYVAPPSYSVPDTWNQAPVDSGANWNQAPPDNSGSWNQAPSDNSGSWNQAPTPTAPGWNTAPSDNSWNQAPATSAPSWNTAPAPSSGNWNQAPSDNSGSWNTAPATSGSWNAAPSGGGSQAPADW